MSLAADSGVVLVPRLLLLTGLPLTRQDQVREVRRTAFTGRDRALHVTYIATDSRVPLPFGCDRSLLVWLLAHVADDGPIRFSSLRRYLALFGLDAGGRAYRLLAQRFQRIANMALRIEEVEGEQRRVHRCFVVPYSVEPRDRRGLAVADPESTVFDRYRFEVDRSFLEAMEPRVPVPLALLREVHNSPLAWDFCCWLVWRCFAARSESLVPWRALCRQLGSRDSKPHRVRRRVEATLEVVRRRWPECPVRVCRAGLLVSPS